MNGTKTDPLYSAVGIFCGVYRGTNDGDCLMCLRAVINSRLRILRVYYLKMFLSTNKAMSRRCELLTKMYIKKTISMKQLLLCLGMHQILSGNATLKSSFFLSFKQTSKIRIDPFQVSNYKAISWHNGRVIISRAWRRWIDPSSGSNVERFLTLNGAVVSVKCDVFNKTKYNSKPVKNR